MLLAEFADLFFLLLLPPADLLGSRLSQAILPKKEVIVTTMRTRKVRLRWVGGIVVSVGGGRGSEGGDLRSWWRCVGGFVGEVREVVVIVE